MNDSFDSLCRCNWAFLNSSWSEEQLDEYIKNDVIPNLSKFTKHCTWEECDHVMWGQKPVGEIGLWSLFNLQMSMLKPDNLAVGKVVLFIPIIILGLLGNFLILWVLYKFKQTRSCVNIFIGNMALADLLATILLPWAGVIQNVHENDVLGRFYCHAEPLFRCKIPAKYSD